MCAALYLRHFRGIALFLPRRLIELEYLKTKNPSSEEEIKEAKPYRNDMDFAFLRSISVTPGRNSTP